MEELLEIIRETGIAAAYDHFAEGEAPEPPFICYLLPGSRNFPADGRVYRRVEGVRLELYTDRKDPETEDRVAAVLDGHGIFYNRTETWIGSEGLYEVVFSFSMTG